MLFRSRRHDDRTSLGLEECVDDGGLLATNVIVQPMPSLRVDRLANATNDAERAQVSVLDPALAKAAEQANSGWRSVEVRELVLINSLPEASGGRVNRGGLEDGSSNTVGQRSVDEVAIAGVRISRFRQTIIICTYV